MAKDIIITPVDGDIVFNNITGAESGTITQDGNDLVITNPLGDVLIGDGASDVYIGDGINNVDIIFEQSGAIRAEDGSSGITLTLGSEDTNLVFGGATSFLGIVSGFSASSVNSIDIGTNSTPFRNIYAAHHIGGSSINYATSRGWVEDGAPLANQIGFYGGDFTRNGDGDENALVWGLDPFKKKALLWKSILNTSDSDDDGGWNKDITIPANNNIGYLSYYYFYLDFTADNSNDGQYYHGCGTVSGQTINLNDSSNTNPYFNNGALSTSNNGGAFVANRWYLTIGTLQPYNNPSTTTNTINGVYDVETGEKVKEGSEFKMGNNTTAQRHRAYMYYDSSTDADENAYFWNPGFHAMDGSEPKLQDLLKRQLIDANVKVGRDAHNLIDFTADNVITFRINNANELGLEGSALYPATDNGLALGYSNYQWSDLFLASGAVINFNNGDITLTHSSNTLTVAGGTLATAALTTTTIVASGIIKTDSTQAATTVDNGSLQTDGGLSVKLDAVVGDDLIMISDASVIHFGADKDVTLTHVADTGLLLNSTMKIQFNDASQFIHGSSNAQLQIGATDEIGLTATLVDMDANLDLDGNADISGDLTMSGHKMVKFSSTTYGAFDSEDFFRIKFQDFGGVHNDVGIGQTATGMLGFNASPNKSFLFNLGTQGNVLTLSNGQATFDGEVEAASLDINGNADISGDLTLSAGADGALTFGAASSIKIVDNQAASLVIEQADVAYMTFKTSNGSELITANKGFNAAGVFQIGGTAVDSTAAELNVLSGITAVVGELNALDIGSTAVGTAVASKAVILDSNKDYTGLRNFTVSGELDAATGDFSGAVDIAGDLTLSAGGDGALVFATAGQNSIKIPDNQAASLVIEEADTAYMTFTTTNSSELIVANKGFNAAGAFQIGGTAVSATAAELNIMDGDTSATSTTIADADRLVLNDAGTMVQVAVTDIKTYIGAGAADDLTAGDAAVTLSTTSGNITIDSNAGAVSIDGHTGVTVASSNSGDITLDSAADIVIDAAGGNIEFKDAGTLQLTLDMDTTNGAQVIQLGVDSDDLIFKQYDGTTVLTLDDDTSVSVAAAFTAGGIITGTGFTAGNAVLAEAELELLDGLTAGTAIASKVVTTDSNIDTSGQRNLTITGELDAATLDLSGAADIAGALTVHGTLKLGSRTTLNTNGTITWGAANDYGLLSWDTGYALIYGQSGKGIKFATNGSTLALQLDTSQNATFAGTVTAVGSFIIGSADMNEADLEKLDGITNGAGAANKALVLDGDADIASGVRNITIDGELDAATLDISGAVDIAGNSVLASVDVTGLATAATFEPDGDTAAGDNAAIGYTSAEGLILTGQGSTNDVTIKNDADADVIEIPTGTVNVTMAGTLGVTGVVSGAGFTAGNAVIAEAELELLDGLTAGTAIASKVVTTDGNIDTSGQRNLTITGELDAATLDISGAIDVAGNSVLASVDVTGLATAATFEPDGDTGAGDNAAIGYTSAEGLILTGQGSTNDVTIKNDADADVIEIPTGTTNVTIAGTLETGGTITATTSIGIGSAVLSETEMEMLDGITAGTAAAGKAMVLDSNADITGGRHLTISGELDAATLDISGAVDIAGNSVLASVDVTGLATAATFEPDGDTAAGDNAAIGYTSAEGLILTGQGSTNDVTIKNDADADVIEIPTGTVNVTMAGTLGVTGVVSGAGFTAGNAVIAEAELELLDGLTAGTAIASKVVTTDSNKDTSGQRNLTISGELDAATGDFSGAVDIAGDLTLSAGGDGALVFATAGQNSIKIPDNQAAALIIEEANAAYMTFTTTNSSELIVANKGFNAAGAFLLKGTAVGSTAAEIDFNNGVTLGTAIASKTVTTDSNIDTSGQRNLTITGELDAATLDISGAIDVAGNSVLATVDVTGLATAATFEPDGDTAAGDNAAIGYTSAEGLILTGQGSTNDVTIKNDADADVIEIPTGTTNVTIAGTLETGGTITATTSIGIGSAVLTEAELEKLDGITNGTAAANKAVVLGGSGVIAGIGTLGCGAITSTGNSGMAQLTTSGRILVDDTTAATSVNDGSLQTDGGLSVKLDAVIGDDLIMISDGGLIHFGANKEVTLTHVHDAGLLLNSTMKLQFNDASQFIQGNSNAELTIGATDAINLTATDVVISGTATTTGVHTFTDDIIIGDGKTIGSASVVDAMTIASTGIVTFKDDILIKDGGTIGVASSTSAITIASTGIVSFVDDILIKDGGTIGVASDVDSITIASNGVVTFSQAPVFPDGSINILDLDIDGGTDIGAALVDADLFIVDDAAGGTNRKATMARLKTYIGAGAADDLTAGDAAVTVSTTSGNVTVDSNAGAVSIDGHTGVTLASSNSGNILLDSAADIVIDAAADIVIDAAGGNIEFKDAGALQLTLDMDTTNGAQVIQLGVDGDDLIFKQYDGTTVLTLDDNTTVKVATDLSIGDDISLISDAAILGFGADTDVTLTHVADTGLLLNAAMKIQFHDASQYIHANGNAQLTIAATDEINLTSTLIDLDGNLDISGTALTTGIHTFTAIPVMNGGLTIATDKKLQFRDGNSYIHSNAANDIKISATDMTFSSSGIEYHTSDQINFQSATSNSPLVMIKNTTNDSNGGRLRFFAQRKNNGNVDAQDDDQCGKIEFYSMDDGTPSGQEYARILATIHDATAGQESGRLQLQVASHDGGGENGLVLTGGSVNAEVDVTIGNGAAALITLTGTLTMGETAAMTNAGLLVVANQSNITGTGALVSGTIGNNFGTINNGSSTITTTGAVATGALTVGGDFIVNGDNVTFESDQADDPLVTIKNTHNSTNEMARLQFVKDRGAAPADLTNVAEITFVGENSNQAAQQYGRIFSEIITDTAGSEVGAVRIGAATKDGENQYGIQILGTTTEDRIDVIIATDSSSETKIAGTLTMGTTATLNNTGVLQTAAQTNITSLGTIAALTTSGKTNIQYREFAASGTTLGAANGDVVYSGNTSTAQGKIYYLNASAGWTLSNADAVADASGLLAVALGTNSTTHGMLLRGMVTVTDLAGTEDEGNKLYLKATDGIATATAPTGNNHFVRIIGYYFSVNSGSTNDQIWFNPDNTFIKVSS